MNDTLSLADPALTLLQSAVLAPSSHNTQPWRFRVSDTSIDLLADRIRALPVNDPDDRELTISCGCALMNLRTAAAGLGLDAKVDLLPSPAEPDWLARVMLDRSSGKPAAESELMPFIEGRRTWRKRFTDRPVGKDEMARLAEAAGIEGAWLRPLLEAGSRHELVALIIEGDAMQWANPSWRRELALWMHPRRQGDGLTVPELAAPLAQFVVRSFDMGGGVAAKDLQLAEASPLLAVLGTQGDQPHDWLLAGQALQRVLLTACRLGLQASYLNQPVEIAALRSKLRDITGEGFPQIVLRLGYPGDELPATPRRPLGEIIEQI
jgi:nitroreductase